MRRLLPGILPSRVIPLHFPQSSSKWNDLYLYNREFLLVIRETVFRQDFSWCVIWRHVSPSCDLHGWLGVEHQGRVYKCGSDPGTANSTQMNRRGKSCLFHQLTCAVCSVKGILRSDQSSKRPKWYKMLTFAVWLYVHCVCSRRHWGVSWLKLGQKLNPWSETEKMVTPYSRKLDWNWRRFINFQAGSTVSLFYSNTQLRSHQF